jgi:hypothetical protein
LGHTLRTLDLFFDRLGRGGSGEPTAITAQREIIKTLLSIGLRPGLKNSSGKTVLNSAQSD